MIKVNFETRKRLRIVFIFLSGKTKQLSWLGNYWVLLSIYGNLIYATESSCFGTKMAAYFNDLKDEESFVRRTGKLSAQFLASLNNDRNRRYCSKVSLVMNWER